MASVYQCFRKTGLGSSRGPVIAVARGFAPSWLSCRLECKTEGEFLVVLGTGSFEYWRRWNWCVPWKGGFVPVNCRMVGREVFGGTRQPAGRDRLCGTENTEGEIDRVALW